MSTLAAITILAGLIFSLYATYSTHKWKNFKRFLKPGDPVSIFVGEDRVVFLVNEVDDNFVTLNAGIGEIKANWDQVYPLFFYRYSE